MRQNIHPSDMANFLRRTNWSDDKDRERQAVAVLAWLQEDDPVEPVVEEPPAKKKKK